jgi:hypothetical protein
MPDLFRFRRRIERQRQHGVLPQRCIRNYITNTSLDPGGYICNQESTQVYNGDLPDQPFYELVDASMSDATGDHIGYFGVAGSTANNSGIGNFLSAGCTGTTATNCFGRIDNDDALPPLLNTRASYGGPPHTIRAIGGLNPIPNVNVVIGGATAHLSWNDAPTYPGNLRPSTDAPAPPTPVKGVRLYKNFTADCTDPSGADPGWTPIGDFDLGQTSTDDPLLPPGTGCNYYALTIRLLGPGGQPPDLETFRVGANSQGVGGTQTAIRIVRFNAAYVGRGVVALSWQSGIEGDVRRFYVARATSASSPFTRVSRFIPGAGDGHAYSASDGLPPRRAARLPARDHRTRRKRDDLVHRVGYYSCAAQGITTGRAVGIGTGIDHHDLLQDHGSWWSISAADAAARLFAERTFTCANRQFSFS